jgi:ribosome assembly protein YihI (activator of Der GTPase)
MAHSKKSRKVGKIGVSKVDSPRPVKTRPKAGEGKPKNTRGNKSGTRQQVALAQNDSNGKQKQDPKIGSKQAIDLDKYKSGKAPKQAKAEQAAEPETVYKTPQAELDAIENNQELDALLEKQLNQSLSKSEQAFVNKMTDRYRILCDLLGISVDEDDQENDTMDDPFASLDAIKLDDFKD